MPSQETINPSACVRAYPVVERHRFIWLWMGDPALADPALVPDMHWNRRSGLGRRRQDHPRQLRLPPRARQPHGPDPRDLRARLLASATSAVAEAPFDVTHGEKHRHRDALDARHRGAAVLGQAAAASPASVDRWQIIRFEAPCTIAIDVGVAPTGTGAPEGDRSQGVNGFVLNTITPETDKTCHYFWASCATTGSTSSAHHRDPRRRRRHLPRGRADARGAAARHRRESRTASSTTSTSTPARCGRAS